MHLRSILIAAVLLAAPAFANVITFETAPLGPGFSGPITEDGFTYTNAFGGLYVNAHGNPGQDLEGTIAEGGGVLAIQRQGGGTFTFDSVDYAAFDQSGTGTQDLIVGGLLEDFIVFDEFTLSNTSVLSPAYGNWTTEYAGNLAGLQLDTLIIILGAGTDPDQFTSAIDNVVLTPGPDLPEPATLALMGAGLLGFGARRRKA